MKNHATIALGVLAGALAPLAIVPVAASAAPAAPNGPHGCLLQDGAGNTTPVLHSSDTSTIGGNSCTFTQVDTNEPTGVGGSYFATAASWSITTYVLNGDGTRTFDPAQQLQQRRGFAGGGAARDPGRRASRRHREQWQHHRGYAQRRTGRLSR